MMPSLTLNVLTHVPFNQSLWVFRLLEATQDSWLWVRFCIITSLVESHSPTMARLVGAQPVLFARQKISEQSLNIRTSYNFFLYLRYFPSESWQAKLPKRSSNALVKSTTCGVIQVTPRSQIPDRWLSCSLIPKFFHLKSKVGHEFELHSRATKCWHSYSILFRAGLGLEWVMCLESCRDRDPVFI